jgi:hypothetical protein
MKAHLEAVFQALLALPHFIKRLLAMTEVMKRAAKRAPKMAFTCMVVGVDLRAVYLYVLLSVRCWHN